MSSSAANIPQFYAGRSIFITGGSGFMGKVLVERLLMTCPDIGRVYLLMRNKKDQEPEKRLLQLKQSQVFDMVRKTSPAQLDKLRVICGDTAEPDLGMSSAAIAQLQEVSIVFHSAATLKFDEELRKAVDQNLRSVMRLMDICDRLPNVDAFVHVSTAYCNAERSEVEEVVYPCSVDIPQLLALVDSVPADVLATITQQYISPKPNTYTFTKALAENAVEQHRNHRYPIAIFRPTIVVSALRHPFPGWIENLNGPAGVVAAGGKGLLHAFTCRKDARADLLPVDIAIDTLIAVAWETATDKPREVRVYNCTTGENPTTWRHFHNSIVSSLRWEYPVDDALWYPSGETYENRHVQKLFETVLQTAPLYVFQFMTQLFGMKTRLNLITVSQRLCAMNSVLTFFSVREWRFGNARARGLRARLSAADRRLYNLDPNTIQWDELYRDFTHGTRKYILKQDDHTLDKAKQHVRKMGLLHYGVQLIALILFLRLILQNQFARTFVYGTLRLFTSFYNYITTPSLSIVQQ